MARTREKVVFEISRSFNGTRSAEEVFADAFVAHMEALARSNRLDDTFDGDESTRDNIIDFREETRLNGTAT